MDKFEGEGGLVQWAHKDSEEELCDNVLVNIRGSQQGGAQVSWGIKAIQGEEKEVKVGPEGCGQDGGVERDPQE